MKRSALYHPHKIAGALWAERHGWEVAASFGNVERELAHARAGVALSDISYLRKFESPAPRPGSWKLAEKRHLVMGEPPLEAPPGALDITSTYSVILMTGPRSRDVLCKLTSMNVSDKACGNLACKQASLAHAHSIVIRQDLGQLLAYKILVTRDYAESVWDSILHAGHEFHITPMGQDALDGLGA